MRLAVIALAATAALALSACDTPPPPKPAGTLKSILHVGALKWEEDGACMMRSGAVCMMHTKEEEALPEAWFFSLQADGKYTLWQVTDETVYSEFSDRVNTYVTLKGAKPVNFDYASHCEGPDCARLSRLLRNAANN